MIQRGINQWQTFIYKHKVSSTVEMNQDDAPKAPEGVQDTAAKLKLYIYGSCESDQYYHPKGDSQSKRPICLTDIQNFQDDSGEGAEGEGEKLIRNPLFKADIYKIACGTLHTLVLTSTGTVYSFGCNDEGALGRVGSEKIPIEVKVDQPIHLISAGDNHSVFANSVNGSVYFSGSYKYMRGESISQQKVLTPIKYSLKDIDYKMANKTIQKVVSGNNHSAILVGGKIFIRGEPETHAIGRRISARHKVQNSMSFDGVGLSNVENLWCGGYHSFAKVRKHNKWHYYMWGLNKHGQLGMRNYEEYGYPMEVKKFSGLNIVDVAAGTNFTICMTQDSEIYGCGQNDYGQLALGEGYEYENSEAEGEIVVQQDFEHKDNQQKVEASNQVMKELPEKKQQILPEKVEEKVEQKKVQSELRDDMERKMSLQDAGNPEARQPEANETEKIVQNNRQPENIIQNGEEALKKIDQKVQTPVVIATVEGDNKVTEEKQEVMVIPAQPLKMEVEQPQPVHEKLKEQNMYIKSFKTIELDERVSRISAGSDFTFAWNDKSLYSWGVGMNYVLLNGQEDDEYSPFKVKPKILNEQSIYDIKAGAQHVAYLAFSSQSPRPKPHLSEKALEKLQSVSQSLKKKKR